MDACGTMTSNYKCENMKSAMYVCIQPAKNTCSKCTCSYIMFIRDSCVCAEWGVLFSASGRMPWSWWMRMSPSRLQCTRCVVFCCVAACRLYLVGIVHIPLFCHLCPPPPSPNACPTPSMPFPSFLDGTRHNWSDCFPEEGGSSEKRRGVLDCASPNVCIVIHTIMHA